MIKPIYSALFLGLAVMLTGCASDERKKASALAQEKSPADVYVQLGIQYMGLGKLDVALKNLNKALEVDPRNADAHNTIAVLYERMVRTDLAATHYKRALKLSPTDPSIHNNYGQFLCSQGEYEEADPHFQAAFDNPVYPKPWVALTNAGHCARLAGDSQLAEQYLRKALMQNAEFKPALLEMMTVSYTHGNLLSVRAFLQRYLAIGSHTPETLRIGILSERQMENFELASQYGEYLLTRFPDSPEALALSQGRLQ